MMLPSTTVERAGATLEFGVLGPVQLLVDGRPAALGGSGVRSLLALLVLDANKVVPFDLIVDALWRDDPPETARTIVHGYVSKLRRILAKAGGAASIRTQPPGYVLQVQPELVDLHRAKQLIGEAGGRPAAERAELLGRALELWRGPMLAGAQRHTGSPDIDELRLAAVEERIAADLELGRHAEVIGELRRLVDDYPFRERLLSLLMLAQYRSARRIDALVSYRRFHRYATEELGVDPGPELRQLHEQVLRDDPGLRLPAPAQTGRQVYGPLIPAQLPAATSAFAGRDVELAWLDGLQHGGGVDGAITVAGVVGPAGIGKTALALTWAHRNADAFPDGQLFAALRGFDPGHEPTSPADVLTQFLLALGVPAEAIPLDRGERAGLYRSLLAERRVLVLLDDARDSEQVRPLLPAGSGSLVLVTSRRRLDGLVARGGARLLALTTLSSEASVRLLDFSTGHQRRSAEIDSLRRLAALCGHLPLALRIAAARLAASPQWTVDDLVAELADEQHRLRALDLEDADTSVRGAFDVSYRTLHPELAETFRAIGVHEGTSVTPHVVAALTSVDLVTARRRLRELASAHLLTETRADRYTLHDLIRLHAREVAGAELTVDQRASAAEKLLDYYLLVADRAHRLIRPPRDAHVPTVSGAVAETPVLASAEQALRWFDAEWPNLVAAVRLGAAVGLDRHTWQLALCLRTYVYLRGLTSDWAMLFELGLRGARAAGDRDGESRMLRGLGNAAELVGEFDLALTHYQDAYRIAADLDDPALLATAGDNLGGILADLGRFDEAAEHLRTSLDLFRRIGDCQGEAIALNNLGVQAQDRGDHQAAFDYYERALALHRSGGNHEDGARSLANLCWVSRQLGRYAEAEGYARDGLRLAQTYGMAYVEAMLHHQLGELHLEQGRAQAARLELNLALTVYRRMRSPYAEAVETLLAGLADV
ncbi:BTAD domain-containing putative transcriptional regulator [Kutzneria buriramensis]|uniref:DNA-binding SARP family transcriptional activator n=1 Tax=Kutzneria buriramensis TaxID=1045776 RepID=A0A3E0HV25_9PSEU|nr:BTAD domain-containing putative transcriptional regulator [Kutzneria buriramensis]REH50304.1 DNA-binding SARP family transcriptional activator [Kutzneria buriramensis]